MKHLIVLLTSIVILSQSAFSHSSPAISRVEVKECKPIQSGGSEILSSALLAAFASAAVKEAVVLGQKWFKDFKDGYKGADIVENIVNFECDKGAGLNTEIVYNRTVGKELHIQLISSLTYFKSGKSFFFELSPKSIKYNKPIAKRGKTKDITVTYNFTFYDADGKEIKSTAGPILIKGVSEGQFIPNLDELYGPKAFIKMPTDGVFTDSAGTTIRRPAKISVEIAEASQGKGEELLGNIMKSVGETAEKNQDAIVSAILAKILDDNTVKESDTGTDKPDGAGGTSVEGVN